MNSPIRLQCFNQPGFFCAIYINLKIYLTIRDDSELVAVLADPKLLRTVKAAAKCLKASVSGPPPATAKSCLKSNMEAWLFPDPLVPTMIKNYCYINYNYIFLN